jgi:hypothetical protein|tara:strand:+ start:421 stop:753 length:333 start_codon:yes stop_codon:yes gene_type:complete
LGIFRVYAGADGESHIEELDLDRHPELESLRDLTEVRVKRFPELRNMDFHPLPERRLIIHVSGEAEIGLSDGTKHIFRPGDVRLMEDTTGRGHTHRDLSLNTAVYVLLSD